MEAWLLGVLPSPVDLEAAEGVHRALERLTDRLTQRLSLSSAPIASVAHSSETSNAALRVLFALFRGILRRSPPFGSNLWDRVEDLLCVTLVRHPSTVSPRVATPITSCLSRFPLLLHACLCLSTVSRECLRCRCRRRHGHVSNPHSAGVSQPHAAPTSEAPVHGRGTRRQAARTAQRRSRCNILRLYWKKRRWAVEEELEERDFGGSGCGARCCRGSWRASKATVRWACARRSASSSARPISRSTALPLAPPRSCSGTHTHIYLYIREILICCISRHDRPFLCLRSLHKL